MLILASWGIVGACWEILAMLGFGFILKAVLAVSIMLAALALVGAPDWLAEQETSMPMKPEPALDAERLKLRRRPRLPLQLLSLWSRLRRRRSRHRQR